MFVVIFFVVTMATFGTRKERPSTQWLVIALSAMCCALLFSQRFG